MAAHLASTQIAISSWSCNRWACAAAHRFCFPSTRKFHTRRCEGNFSHKTLRCSRRTATRGLGFSRSQRLCGAMEASVCSAGVVERILAWGYYFQLTRRSDADAECQVSRVTCSTKSPHGAFPRTCTVAGCIATCRGWSRRYRESRSSAGEISREVEYVVVCGDFGRGWSEGIDVEGGEVFGIISTRIARETKNGVWRRKGMNMELT